MGKAEGKGKGGESKRKEKGNMRYELKAKYIRIGIGLPGSERSRHLECCGFHCMSGAIRI